MVLNHGTRTRVQGKTQIRIRGGVLNEPVLRLPTYRYGDLKPEKQEPCLYNNFCHVPRWLGTTPHLSVAAPVVTKGMEGKRY